MEKSLILSRVLCAIVIALLTMGGARAQDDDTPEPDSDAAVIASVQTYVADNLDGVGVACFPIGYPGLGVYHNADARFPLASTIKILVLAEFARQASIGTLNLNARVPLADLDAYYLPRTDGGAHTAFLGETTIANETLSLADVARGMIRYSSNAATDYLVSRLGRENFPALYSRLGMQATDQPTNFLGLFLALENHETGRADVETLTEAVVAFESSRLADRYVYLEEWREEERDRRAEPLRGLLGGVPPDDQIAYFARFGGQGSARDFASLMAAIYEGRAISSAVSAMMREFLEWPLEFSHNRAAFDSLGLKGGSLPGLLTGAWFGQLRDGPPVALAVFYRDLSIDTWRAWRRDFDHQYLEFEALRTVCGALQTALDERMRSD